VWITELGYEVGAWDATYGVDLSTQAKNVLNATLDAYQGGVERTFIYMLNDYTWSSTNVRSFNGIFYPDGSAKPAADALHNLTSLLADRGANAQTFTTQALSYSVSN
jgi:hypothetical protein